MLYKVYEVGLRKLFRKLLNNKIKKESYIWASGLGRKLCLTQRPDITFLLFGVI